MAKKTKDLVTGFLPEPGDTCIRYRGATGHWVFGVKSVLMGFGLNSDDIHSPNEHYGLFNYYKGIETIPLFFKHYARMKAGK